MQRFLGPGRLAALRRRREERRLRRRPRGWAAACVLALGTASAAAGQVIDSYEPDGSDTATAALCAGSETTVRGRDFPDPDVEPWVLRIGQGAAAVRDLTEVLGWTPMAIRVRLPADLEPGTYWIALYRRIAAAPAARGPESLRVSVCGVAPIVAPAESVLPAWRRYEVTITLSEVRVLKSCDQRTNGEWWLSLRAALPGTDPLALRQFVVFPEEGAAQVRRDDTLEPGVAVTLRDVPVESAIEVELDGGECDRREGRPFQLVEGGLLGAGTCRDAGEERREFGGRHGTLGTSVLDLEPARWREGGEFALVAGELGSCRFHGGHPYTAEVRVTARPVS